MARYNFIAETDINFTASSRSEASGALHFRGTDLNYLACRYAIHRQLNPPATPVAPRAGELLEDHDDDDNQRSGWLDRLFQRLAMLGEPQHPRG